MLAQECAAAQSAQQQHQAQGGGGPRHGRRNFFLHREVFGIEVMVLDDLDHGVEQENKQKPNAKSPYLARQMSERKILRPGGGTHPLNPKMRRGLSVLPVY
jgi:hypothetical protein